MMYQKGTSGKNMKVFNKLGEKALALKDKVCKFVAVASAVLYVSASETSVVFASSKATTTATATGTSAVTGPIDKLKDLFIAVIGAVGVIILAKNIMETAQAYQQQDSASMNSGIKGIVAGAMMAGISAVLALLGF